MADKVWLTDREIAVRLGIARPTVWGWVKKGRFPAPYKISENTSRWKLSEVEAWEQARTAA